LLRSRNDTSAFSFYVALSSSPNQSPISKYIPRGRNQFHTIFEQHFAEFCDQFDERYAKPYGLFRLERIQSVGEKFCICGDYLQGIARIRCTNPVCGHDYFRPFDCKGFSLCPSCSQKRTLLFAEYLTQEVLLDLPHRQFVFAIPKALRLFFRSFPSDLPGLRPLVGTPAWSAIQLPVVATVAVFWVSRWTETKYPFAEMVPCKVVCRFFLLTWIHAVLIMTK
jgi:hypothetical protein